MLGRSSLSAALVALSVPAVLGLGLGPGAGPTAADPGPVPGGADQTGHPGRTVPVRPAPVSRSAQRRAQVVAKAQAAADDAPLAVTIDDLSPSTIPERGPIRVQGTVTNRDTVARTTINIYAFVSDEPLTTSAELADAAATEPEEFVGERIADEDHKDTIAALEPGESASFDFSVPRGLLGASEAGVYWFGVHALSDNTDGTPRDALTDGRARTFLPLITERTQGQVDAAVAIPLRRQLVYNDDGSLDDLATWTRTLSSGGRLSSLVDFGAGSGSDPVTWVVDPALVDAVRRLAEGNPPRSLEANLDQGEDDGESDSTEPPDPSISPAPTAGKTAATDEETADDNDSPLDLDELDPVVQAASQAATDWLQRLGEAMGSEDQVLTLPYGDVDVPAAAQHDPALLQRAFARSAAGLSGFDVPTAPAVVSPSGFLSAAALAAVPEGTIVVVSDAVFEPGQRDLEEGVEPPTEPAPSAATIDGRQVLVSSSGAADGGPGPDDRTGLSAMRQRLLAEAAVRLLEPTAPPLTLLTPHDWNPAEPGSSFFTGLDSASWLQVGTLADVANDAAAPIVAPADLRYPAWQAETELSEASFDSADELTRTGAALQSLLTLNNLIGGTVADQALATTSYSARTRPTASRASADGSRDWIEDRLGEVTVSAPQAVTLASSSGPFNAVIANRLDQPVTVSLEAGTDRELTISGPQAVEIAPRSRSTVRLRAGTEENGIHQVRLLVTDKRGVPLGGATTLTVRSAQVSNVIWLFIGVGAALLFGAIGVRLFRRIRNARRTPPPTEPTTDRAAEPAEPAAAGQR